MNRQIPLPSLTMSGIASNRVLVAPLNWGLGHATRCVPIIKKLQAEGKEVILTACGRSKDFLKREFPELEFVDSPHFSILYSKVFPMWMIMLLQSPRILWNIYIEHKWLNNFLERNEIDEVISDNRYGLWSNKVRCVFITHQLMIKCPGMFQFLEPLLHRLVLQYVKKYSECWIPDIDVKINLSGDLSHKFKIPENTKFIGFLSRFEFSKDKAEFKTDAKNKDEVYSICFLLSGPEPLRTELEMQIRAIEKNLPKKCLLIQGKPETTNWDQTGQNLIVGPHIDDMELQNILLKTPLIVCRAGYSSIMDLKVLGRSALLIPTPGQTEQEYLTEYLSESGLFDKMLQENFGKDFISYQQNFFSRQEQKNNTSIAELTGIQNDGRSSDRIALIK